MYYPYFRGKQFELVALRENAKTLANAGFVPIIEPVKTSLNGLKRALDSISEANGRAILIANPEYGDHATDPAAIAKLLEELGPSRPEVAVGILLGPEWNAQHLKSLCTTYAGRDLALIHAGATDPKGIVAAIAETDVALVGCHQIFIESYCTTLYRRHFQGQRRVLVGDGFERRPNRSHPDVESFSDLHVTFTEQQMNGFGDFLVVGDEYSETGGPAYAVAIHLTYIDADMDDEMYIHHFKSDRSDTPSDPAGKFLEALHKLVANVTAPATKVLHTAAVTEFLQLSKTKHFPGLGYIKKLSMAHHIETLARYFERKQR